MARIEKVDGINYYGEIIEKDSFTRNNIIKFENHFSYDEIDLFVDGFAKVRRGQYWGVIDSHGQEIIPCIFIYIGDYSDGAFPVQDHLTGLWGFYSVTGEIIARPEYPAVQEFSEGLASVADADNNLWGYINKQNEFVIDPIYLDALSFSEGLAGVQDPETFKWGYIDEKNNIIIPFMYDEVHDFLGGYTLVSIDENDYIINQSNEIVYDVEYNDEEDDEFDDQQNIDLYVEPINLLIDQKTTPIYYLEDIESMRLGKNPNFNLSFSENGHVGTFFEGEDYDETDNVMLVDKNILAVSSKNKWGLRHINGKYLTSGLYHYQKDLNQTTNFRYIEKVKDHLQFVLMEEFYGIKIFENNQIPVYRWYKNEEQRDKIYSEIEKDEYNLENADAGKMLTLN